MERYNKNDEDILLGNLQKIPDCEVPKEWLENEMKAIQKEYDEIFFWDSING